MEFVLELILYICLDIAAAILLYGIARRGNRSVPCGRLIAGMFGLGFVFATIASGVRGMSVFLVPDIIGFVLSYSAFIFTFPTRTEEKKK